MAAITQGTARKSAVSTLRFAVAPLTLDNGTTLTYGAVHEIENNLVTVKYAPEMQSASQYASGIEVDGYVAKAGGSLDVSLVNTNSEDDTILFGTAVEVATGVSVSNKDDIVPDVMVIYSTKNSDGTINLYKFPKAKFTSQGESTQTVDDKGVTYNSVSLQAKYKALINNGDEMYSVKGLDISSTEGKAFETAWFASATGGISV